MQRQFDHPTQNQNQNTVLWCKNPITPNDKIKKNYALYFNGYRGLIGQRCAYVSARFGAPIKMRIAAIFAAVAPLGAWGKSAPKGKLPATACVLAPLYPCAQNGMLGLTLTAWHGSLVP